MTGEAITVLMIQGLALLAGGLIGGAIAHRLGTPRLVGALLIGLLLGPTVMGRVAPGAYRYLIAGGYEQYDQLRRFDRERAEGRRVLRETGVSEAAVDEYDAETRRQRQTLQAELERGEASHEAAFFALTMLTVLPLLLAEGWHFGAARPRGLARALPVALACVLTAAALAALFGWLLLRTEWVDPEGIGRGVWLGGIVLGCAAISPVTAGHLLAGRKDEQDRPLEEATRGVALVGAIAVWAAVAIAAARLAPAPMDAFDHPITPFLPLLALALGVAGFLLGAAVPPIGRTAFWFIPLEALLAAMLGARVDLIVDFDWLLTLLVLIALSDGKSLGAVVGGGLFHRRSFWDGMRLGAAVGTGGPLTLALLLLLRAVGWIDAALMTALVLAVALTAIIGPWAIGWIDRLQVESGLQDHDQQ